MLNVYSVVSWSLVIRFKPITYMGASWTAFVKLPTLCSTVWKLKKIKFEKFFNK